MLDVLAHKGSFTILGRIIFIIIANMSFTLYASKKKMNTTSHTPSSLSARFFIILPSSSLAIILVVMFMVVSSVGSKDIRRKVQRDEAPSMPLQ